MNISKQAIKTIKELRSINWKPDKSKSKPVYDHRFDWIRYKYGGHKK